MAKDYRQESQPCARVHHHLWQLPHFRQHVLYIIPHGPPSGLEAPLGRSAHDVVAAFRLDLFPVHGVAITGFDVGIRIRISSCSNTCAIGIRSFPDCSI